MRKKGKGHKLMNIPPIPSRSGRRDSNFHSLLCFCAVVLNMKGEKIISCEEEIQFALSLPRHDSQPKAESEETMEMCIVERQTIETNKKLPWLGVQQVPAGDSERKPFKIQAVRSYSGSFAIDSTFFLTIARSSASRHLTRSNSNRAGIKIRFPSRCRAK